MSVKSKRHLALVATIPCLICEQMGLGWRSSQVHHISDTAHRSDWLTIPLCEDHHTGAEGFHGLGEREFNRRYKTTELHLLAQTIERLA